MSRSQDPNLFGWWLLAAPFSIAFGIYGTLAGLNAVRSDLPAWRSWMKAFRLIPRSDLLRTIGLLTGAHLPVFITQMALQVTKLERQLAPASTVESTNVPSITALILLVLGRFVLSVLVALAGWYLSLCAVAIWRKYAAPPATESPSPVEKPLDPSPESV